MGQPEGINPFLNQLGDIKTVWDSGWHWTISHPSFYYWNRMISTAFGTGTVYLTYLIAEKVFDNRWIALIAALFIGATDLHVEFSALITPDVPTVFFSLGTVLFALKFLNEGKVSDYVFALIFSGIAVSIKYNSAITVLIPLAALLIRSFTKKTDFSSLWVLLLIAVPVTTFIICMPYALLDTAGFLNGLGSELRHYKVQGHGSQSSTPGLAHMQYQLSLVKENIGGVSLFIAFAGTAAIAKKPKLLFVILLPILYFLYMTQMKVNFHRNFLLLYPFLGVLYSASAWILFDTLSHLNINATNRVFLNLKLLAPLILAALLIGNVYHTAKSSLAIHRTVDSRSQIIAELNRIDSSRPLYLASELRFHDQDLRKLRSHKVKSLNDIFTCQDDYENAIAVIPSELFSMYKSGEDQEKIKQFESHKPFFELNQMLMKTGAENRPLLLDIYSINPEILVLPMKNILRCH